MNIEGLFSADVFSMVEQWLVCPLLCFLWVLQLLHLLKSKRAEAAAARDRPSIWPQSSIVQLV